ncbi:hypothetical protein [Bacillus cereus]|uniref:hypothetical protein n=1 Tax=Bacillus cereus TaxID=1396 RepID=UPI0009949B6F|nr:hypothetical protein [Bacillus cereus]OOZ90068.1 hypothetical protein BHL25_04985 [Bacillus cereus]
MQARCKPCNGAAKSTNTHTLIIPIEVDGELVDHRKCKGCGDTLPLRKFYKNGRGGYKPRCAMCENEKIRKGKAILKALKSEKIDDVTKSTS